MTSLALVCSRIRKARALIRVVGLSMYDSHVGSAAGEQFLAGSAGEKGAKTTTSNDYAAVLAFIAHQKIKFNLHRVPRTSSYTLRKRKDMAHWCNINAELSGVTRGGLFFTP